MTVSSFKSIFFNLPKNDMDLGSNEMIIIFNSRNNAHKEVIAYANIISGKVRTYDVTDTKLTEKALLDLSYRMMIEVRDLIDVSGDAFRQLRLRLDKIDNQAAIGLITEYPELLKTPILMMGNRTIFVKDKHDIMNLAVA